MPCCKPSSYFLAQDGIIKKQENNSSPQKRKRMKTFTLLTALALSNLVSFSQNICPSSFKRNNGNGTCGSLGELRLNFSPACPSEAPLIDSVFTNGTKNSVTFALPDASHCGNNNGYLSYCVTSGNMPPANVWVIYFHTSAGSYNCTVTAAGGSILPIKYSSFDAYKNNEAVVCNWTTEEEINNNYFILEKSSDGTKFNNIAMIFSAGNNAGIRNSYKYKDAKAFQNSKGIVYYRLVQVDLDGKTSYSKTISVKSGTVETAAFQVSPNPFDENTMIKINAADAGNATIKIFNTAGQTVMSKQATVNKGVNNLSVNSLNTIARGMYVMQVSINGVCSGNQKIIKN